MKSLDPLDEKRCETCRRQAMPYDGDTCPKCGTEFTPKWVEWDGYYCIIDNSGGPYQGHRMTGHPDGSWDCTCTDAGLTFCVPFEKVQGEPA